jgi:hypothetical protein
MWLNFGIAKITLTGDFNTDFLKNISNGLDTAASSQTDRQTGIYLKEYERIKSHVVAPDSPRN